MNHLPSRSRARTAICLMAVALSATFARAAIEIDATTPPLAPQPLAFAAGGTSPDGHTLGINSEYFTKDGKPWFPIMGEFQFSRYPAAEWETELLKMKAGGIDIVSTYVIWIFHEEKEGEFEWSGQRDLRRFLQLCEKHGMPVWMRVGPWVHGEVRDGGFPDWVLAGKKRENDPVYLQRVTSFFNEIGRQTHGLYWGDGGPIVGVQLENEYHPVTGGVEHMMKLLDLAHAAGINAPFYSATGWDHAVVPAQAFVPVFGGYTDQFWSGSTGKLTPNENFFFTPIRAEDNVGYDLKPKDPDYHNRYLGLPYLTAEMGGGMAIAYHRRPVMQSADSTSAALVRLGSGVTLLGYYLYHGGTNPDGNTPMEESLQGWNGFQDLETKSYDFQTALGEFGQVRETYKTMKALHLFLHEDGGELATMAAYFPKTMPANLDDTTTPRVALRSDGKSGFLFINNFERNYPLADHDDFQVAVALPSGTVTVPEKPTRVPSGAYTFWPINMDVGGTTLRYATAEPLTRLEDPDSYVFFEEPGIRPEFLFEAERGLVVKSDAGHVTAAKDGTTVVNDLAVGLAPAFTLTHADGKVTQVFLLSRANALNLWKKKIAGRERLILSPGSIYFEDGGIHVDGGSPGDLKVAFYPMLESAVAGFARIGTTGVFDEYASTLAALPEAVASVHQTKEALPAHPVKINADPLRMIAMAPAEADFDGAAAWTINFPDDVISGSGKAMLSIKYQGDVARLYAGDRLLEDNYYKGTPLVYGLWRLTPAELRAGLTLKVLPLRKDAPVYIPEGAWPTFDANGQADSLDSVSISWGYEAVLVPPSAK